MKTQINNLINGKKNVIRQADHAKYLTANNATSHIGYAGTSASDRAQVAQQVAVENTGELNVEIKGVAISLTRNNSISGKSWFWAANLSNDQYVAITGSDFGLGKNTTPGIIVNGDCTITVSNGGKHFVDIDEAFVTIL